MSDSPLQPVDPVQLALDRTPARVLVGRAGPGYRTATALKLREDHAAARDAVKAEIDLQSAFGSERIAHFQLFEIRTQATSKVEYLLRPDLGRKLDDESRELTRANCSSGCDLQVVIGDGLSATPSGAAQGFSSGFAMQRSHAAGRSAARSWSVTAASAMNDVGDLLEPKSSCCFIGEASSDWRLRDLSA